MTEIRIQDIRVIVENERIRQIEKEGYTLAHDDQHENGEIGIAALCYEQEPLERDLRGGDFDIKITVPNNFPWNDDYWKPTPNDRNRELIKAGALYMAEIERLERRLSNVCVKISKLQ